VSAQDRFQIPSLGIDAPLTYGQVVGGNLPNTKGADDVIIYDFSGFDTRIGGWPGIGGNAILLGQVDSRDKPCDNGTVPPPCEAVWWNIDKLQKGDEIKIVNNGQIFTYSVRDVSKVGPDGDLEKILSATQSEQITLMTPAGNDPQNNQRTVVVADRIT
jgi:hypothetical protein